jgi:hypothetical protein
MLCMGSCNYNWRHLCAYWQVNITARCTATVATLAAVCFKQPQCACYAWHAVCFCLLCICAKPLCKVVPLMVVSRMVAGRKTARQLSQVHLHHLAHVWAVTDKGWRCQ